MATSRSTCLPATPIQPRRPAEAARQRYGDLVSSTPTTPQSPLGRSYSSTHGSPSAGLWPDEDTFIFEFNTRFFSGGIAGESIPRSQLDFSPEGRTRLGDYSQWLPQSNHDGSRLRPAEPTYDAWGRDHELWRMDVRQVNLGLFIDLVERTVREAILKDILVLDGKRRKFVLALPPALPDPLLETLLLTLFNSHPLPTTITLLPCPVLCAVAAGLRSALVVDIAWEVTTVSAIYEYRQVLSRTSARGTKRLSWAFRELLLEELRKAKEDNPSDQDDLNVAFAEVEDTMTRMAWCQKSHNSPDFNDTAVNVPVSTRPIAIPFHHFSQPAEFVFFNTTDQEADNTEHPDDDEKSIPALIFEALLALPIDVRQTCLSRIVITGAGSDIPGLRRRLLSEVQGLIKTRGWDVVSNYGSVATHRKVHRSPSKLGKREVPWHGGGVRNVPLPSQTVAQAPGADVPATVTTSPPASTTTTPIPTPTNKDINALSTTPAHAQPPLADTLIHSALRSRTLPSLSAQLSLSERSERNEPGERSQRNPRSAPPPPAFPEHTPPHSRIRGVLTAGAWAGASLLAGLHIPGVVEIERERFLRGGLAGLESRAREEAERVGDGGSLTRRTVSELRKVTGGMGVW